MNRWIKPAGCAVPNLDKHRQVKCLRQHHHRMAGFSYVEVLVATILIALALVPAMDGLSTGIQGSRIHETHAMDFNHLTARLEEILSEPFASLEAAAAAAGSYTNPSSYSDSITTADGRTLTRQVFLARYDGDNVDDSDPFTGADAGLIWVKVQLADTVHAVESLVSTYGQ